MRQEASIESWRKLYEISTEIKKMEPWEYFWDTDVINLSDEDVYISIFGRNHETYGISIYEGEAGFNKFKILENQALLNLSPHMAMYMQENLTCYWGDREELSKKQRDIIRELGYKYRGRNQWLYFMSFKPNYMPYNFNADEVDRMTTYLTKLKNALDLYIGQKPEVNFEDSYILCYSDKNKKITEKEINILDFDIDYVQPDNIAELASSLKKLPKKTETLEVDILPLYAAVKDKAYDRPANPTVAMVAEKKSGLVIASEVSSPETDMFENFFNTVVDTFLNYGIPRSINVCNSITGYILEKLCDEMGISLSYEIDLPALDETKRSLMNFMR